MFCKDLHITFNGTLELDKYSTGVSSRSSSNEKEKNTYQEIKLLPFLSVTIFDIYHVH